MVARAGFEPTTLRSKGINYTNAPPRLSSMGGYIDRYKDRGTDDDEGDRSRIADTEGVRRWIERSLVVGPDL